MPDRTWFGPFSRRHPEVPIEVLGRSEVDSSTMVADVWIGGGPAGVWSRPIGGYADVGHVEALAEVGSGSLYRVRFQSPPIVAFYRDLEVPLPFPLRMQGGYVWWEAVARAPQFRKILEFGRAVDPRMRVSWTRRPPLRDHLPRFTDSQRVLLDLALRSGYFAVPRGVSLTELARRSERSKSAVSEAMARIERSLLESALREHALKP